MKARIKAKWVIKLPKGAKLLIKKGEIVNKSQILAQVSIRQTESFDFSQFFGLMSLEKREGLNDKFKNNLVNKGDLICMTGGIFSKKVCFPSDGIFLEIDEFGNLKIEKNSNSNKEVISPVRAIVSKIEDEKIVLDFEAKEFKGEGLIDGKAWGENYPKLINEIKELTFELKNKIILTTNLSKSFLTKADVVGVTGVITNIMEEDIETNLPVLYLDSEEWNSFWKNYGQKQQDILVNARLGRLLVVVE